MWIGLGLVGVWLGTALLDIPHLWRKGLRKEIIAVIVVMAAVTAGGLVCSFQATPPNPLIWIAAVFSAYSKAFNYLFS